VDIAAAVLTELPEIGPVWSKDLSSVQSGEGLLSPDYLL
jgi:hypothetical protein